MKEETKCYCGHTTYCDCNPETLEEAAEKYADIYKCPATNQNEYCKHDIISAFNNGAKWQQERSYSEEELLEILASYADWSINDIRGWFEQFKKK